MGKQLDRQDSDIEYEGYNPGCVGGILHVLHFYHQRHSNNLKTSPPRRKHRRGKRAICCGNTKTVSFDHNYNNLIHEDPESIPLMIEQENMLNSQTDEVSCEVRTNERMSDRIRSGTKLCRNDAFRHLEYLKDIRVEEIADSVNPTAVPDRGTDVIEKMVENQLSPKESIIETLKINKSLFLEILQDSKSVKEKKILTKKDGTSMIRLKKSRSFPQAVSSQTQVLRPQTLEHKQKEIWSFPKREKSSIGAKETRADESKSSEISFENLTDAKVDDNRNADVVQGTTDVSSVSSTEELNKRGRHNSFLSQFKDIKKVIKHFLKNSKIEELQIDGVTSETKLDDHENLQLLERNKETDSSTNNPSRGMSPSIRRATSLNESMDRYTRLFEYSFNRGAKWHRYQSKSLKLSSEDQFPLNGFGLKRFRRRFSLSDLGSSRPITDEASNDVLCLEKTSTLNERHGEFKLSAVLAENKQFESLDASEETELTGVIRTSELQKDEVKPQMLESNNIQDQDNSTMINCSNEQGNREFTEYHLDSVVGIIEFSASKGFDSSAEQICIEEPNSSTDIQVGSNRNFSVEVSSNANNASHGNANLTTDSNLYGFKANNDMNDADFNYVRDILELSGFIKQDGHTSTWYTMDQPLHPAFFKELEAYLHLETESSSEDISFCLDHQLLFDLINEELLGIYQGSLAYFPRQFYFTQSSLAFPKGVRVLGEIWKRISWYRTSGSENDRSLDDIVALDFDKGNCWMSLNMGCEDVALEMEDWIFDELLDEIVSS